MCSLMVEQVKGLPESLITGMMGFPMMFPWPVGNRCSTAPEAAHNVRASAAAEDVSMNQRPLPEGASAGLRHPTYFARLPIFWIFPNAFSSMVVRPPRMLPLVGWDSDRSSVLFSFMKSLYSFHTFMNCSATAGVAARFFTTCSAPVNSDVSPKDDVPLMSTRRSTTLPTVGQEASPVVVSDSPHLTETYSSSMVQSSRCRSLAC